jgi:hypothetical protein
MRNYKPITKFYALCIALILFMMPCLGQNVAINEDGSLPDPKAILDVKSYSKGILIPRMSTYDRLAIHAPTGLLVFDTTTMSFWYSIGQDSGTIWKNLVTEPGWSLRGNRGDSSYFLGTTNRMALRIKVWGLPSGLIDPVGENTFWGYQAGYSNPVAADSPGTGNTAAGYSSLYANTTGYFNTAYGRNSLRYNVSGNSNTASGSMALFYNTTGSQNTATGVGSMIYNTGGYLNTANGTYALYSNSTGNYNTAVGSYALHSNTTGSFNTAIGYGTIGNGANVNASNKVRIGNSAVTVIEGQVPFTVPSDGRFKYSVKEDVKGLDFILQLRPVTYQFDVKRFNNQYSQAAAGHESNAANYVLQTAYDEAASIRRSGFIAQEVEKAAVASGYNFSGIIQPKAAHEHYSLSYESFVVPLVKAVQELSNEQQQLISAQNKRIEEQDKKIVALQQQLDDIKQLLRAAK